MGVKYAKVKNMDYKIIASDLDGTLLSHDSISKENQDAIKEIINKGVYFVPATGRAFDELPKDLKETELFRYYIVSDGAQIYDKQNNEMFEFSIKKEKTKQILDKLYSYDVCIFVHHDIYSYCDKLKHDAQIYKSYNMNKHWVEFSLAKEVTKENFKEFVYSLEEIPLFVPFFKNMEDLLECKAYFEKDEDLLIAQTDPHNLEIFSKNAGKGNSLLRLAEILGVNKEATIAVGDSTNDYTMVKMAGLGLAVDNAVEELKKVADKVICNYKEHSAKYILENFIK